MEDYRGVDFGTNVGDNLEMEISLAAGISFIDGSFPIADVVAGVMIIGILYNEHTKNKSKSNQEKHESWNARRQRDQDG